MLNTRRESFCYLFILCHYLETCDYQVSDVHQLSPQPWGLWFLQLNNS